MTLRELCHEQSDRLLYLRPRQAGFGGAERLSVVISTIIGHGWGDARVELVPRLRGGPWLVVYSDYVPAFRLGWLETDNQQRRRQARERAYNRREDRAAAVRRREIAGVEMYGGTWAEWHRLPPEERALWVERANR